MESRELDIKNAYNQLMAFELELQKQEDLRKRLGSPFGRAPPLKMSLSSPTLKGYTPNYASGLARHPFLSTLTSPKEESHSNLSSSTSHFNLTSHSFRKTRLPVLVKVNPNVLQESAALRTQTQQRQNLREQMLTRFPSNIKQIVSKMIDHEQQADNLFETDADRADFNPFSRPNAKNYFFPLEMFFDEEVELESVKYPTVGFASYNCGDYYEWRPCKILKYSTETGKFFIKWEGKQDIKETSRHTVRFYFEEEAEFDKKIEAAKGCRVNYEAGIRYLARLELETFKNIGSISITPLQERRIINKIGKDINEIIHEDIFDEIRKNYIRSVVEFKFRIEHFVGEAKKLEKPWRAELARYDKMQPEIMRFRHSNFNCVVKKLNRQLNINSSESKVLMQVVHQLSEISVLKIYGVLIELANKKVTHEEKKLKWIVKEWFGDIKFKVDKLVKGSIKILTQQETSNSKQFYISQILFESHLQVAIRKSTDDLKQHLLSFFAVLPCQNFDPEVFANMSEAFMQTRNKYREILHMYQDKPIQNQQENIPAAIISLQKLLTRQIFMNKYNQNSVPAPLISIQILSRFSLSRQVRGRNFKLFNVVKVPNKPDISKQAFIGKFADDEILKTVEFKVSELRKKTRKVPLITGLNLPWLVNDFEKQGLFITPIIEYTEEALRDILKAPLKSFERVKSISKEKMLDAKLKVANSAECYNEILRELQVVMKYSLIGPLAMLNVLGKYEYLVKYSPSKILEDIKKKHTNDYISLHMTMKKIRRDSEEIEKFLPSTMNFGLFQLDLRNIKSEITNNSTKLLAAILEEIEEEKNNLLVKAHEKFQQLVKKLINPPNSVEEFVEIRDYIEKKGDLEDFKPIKYSLQLIEVILGIMEEFRFLKASNSEEMYWRTKSWRNELNQSQIVATKMIDQLYPHFQTKVKENIDELQRNLEVILKEMTDFKEYNNLHNAEEYSYIAKDIAMRLDSFYLQSKLINNREVILKFEISDFSKIAKMIEDFDMYYKLWDYIKIWNEKSLQWMTQPFRLIKPKDVEDTLRNGFSLLNIIESKSEYDSILISIALIMQTKLNLFEKFLPMIFCLRDRSVQLRHWKEIWRVLKETEIEGIDSHKMEFQTLQNLLDRDILTKMHAVAEIAIKSRHEFEIEKTMLEIEQDLNCRITLVRYEECDKIELVKDINVIIDAIREHLLTLQFLLKNFRYIEHSKGKINDLIAAASKQQVFLEDLSKFQEKWKELFPLFLLTEISDDMRKEANIIKEAQVFYEKKLEYITSGLLYSSVPEGAFKNLLEANDHLDKIRDNIRENLKKKQENCSRLCFMGYESLVIFLRDLVKRKTLNISQLFPGLQSIDVSENNISHVKRGDFDMQLARPVTMFLASKALTLDTWVIDLESSLVATFKEKIHKINVSSPRWWANEKDVQILITAEMIYFSMNVYNGIEEFLHKMHMDVIDDLKSGRYELEKLAVIIAYQLNLLAQLKLDPIIWDFTLKYNSTGPLSVQVLSYSIDFSYEFQNLSDFSYVPTPISEKMMLSIVNCVVSYQTMVISGSSNSGKTSTLKEIALYCGKGICFWTAVAGSSFSVLMSIVSGCASGGFWGVIEEIHNVKLTILSSMLYYLSNIVQKLKAGQLRLMINDKMFKSRPGFCLFFTSSSGEKIPEYLAQNLRITSVVQPDFKMIISVKLQALGHDPAFAGQIATAFELISDNFSRFSSQHSKTFLSKSLSGLNALIKSLPTKIDSKEILNAFIGLFSPELENADKIVFKQTLAEIFPGNLEETAKTLSVDPFKPYGFKSSPGLLNQYEVLIELMKSQFKWVLITGAACSGKSALIGVAANEYSRLNNRGLLVHKLGEINSENLLRLVSICERPSDYKYSYCSYPIGDNSSPSVNDWIVLDSRLNLDWATLNYISRSEIYLNASRRVSVPSSLKFFIECENLNDFAPGDLKNYNIVHCDEGSLTAADIFATELEKLDDPVLISIYQPLFLTIIQPLYQGLARTYFNYSLKIWVLQFLRIVFKMVKEAKSLLSKKYDSLYAQINKNNKTKVRKRPLGNSTLASSIVISDSYVPQHVDKKGEIIVNTIEFLDLSRYPVKIQEKIMFESIFLCAAIYTFGACEEDKQKFHRVVLQVLMQQPEGFAGNFKEKLSTKSVFDVCYAIESQEWLEWDEESMKNRKLALRRQLTLRKSTRALIEVSKSSDSIYIPTEESKKHIYWLSYYLNAGISSILLGQHQTGKSLLATTILKRQLTQGYLAYLPISLTGNTSAQNIQNLITASLDQIKEYYFGCVGGIKQYVIIDDMNLDQSNSIYELLRFWKENHGWYNNEFCFVGQIEMLAVHGYSANRNLYPRALRHFNVVYKEPYTSKDISYLFRNTVDSGTVSIDKSQDELFSVLDLTVDFYKKLHMRLSRVNTERAGYNLSLSAFMLALRKTAELKSISALETDDYLKVFTYIFKGYMLSQIDSSDTEVLEIMNVSYLAFLADFQAGMVDESRVEAESIVIDQSLFLPKPSEEVVLNKKILGSVIEKFGVDVNAAKSENFEETKALGFVFNKPEEMLGKHLLMYMKLLFDLKDCSNCSIICSETGISNAIALMYVAAAGLGTQVFNFTQRSSHFKELVSISEFYLPIEVKFKLREVINRAIQDQHSVVMIETDSQVHHPYVLTVLEIFNDIFAASAFKLPSCYKYYKDIMMKTQQKGINPKNNNNEQVMLSIVEKMQRNIKIVILSRTSNTKFSKLEPMTILEELKHKCRTLFNCAKLIYYDKITVPFFVIEGIIIQDKVLQNWLNKNDRSIFTDFCRKASDITQKPILNEFKLELMCYLSNEIRQQNEHKINKKISKLTAVIAKIEEITVEIESFREKAEDILAEVQRLYKEVELLHDKKGTIVEKNKIIHSDSYVPPFVEAFTDEKALFMKRLDIARAEFEESRDHLLSYKNEFGELAGVSAFQPGMIVCCAYMQYLITPKSKFPSVLTLEALEPLSKPFINNLTFNFNSISKKIKNIQPEMISFNEEVLNCQIVYIFNGNKGLKQYKLLYRFLDALNRYKKVIDEFVAIKAEWSTVEEALPLQAKEAIEATSNQLMGMLSDINGTIATIEDRISYLNETNENIGKIRPKGQQILRNLNQKKQKWQEEILILEKTKKTLETNSCFLTLSVLVALAFPNPIRQELLESASSLVSNRDQSFIGFPKFPSQNFSNLLDLLTLEKKAKGYHYLNSHSFFQQTISAVRSVFNYYLPYPLIIDPYHVFQDFILLEEAQNDIMLLTLDAGFEHVLDKLMTEGKAALVVNPSISMKSVLMNLVKVRIRYFLCRSRGLPYDNLMIRIANQFIKFNPKFRLYVCSDEPAYDILENFTLFSMEIQGNEWKSMVYSKLQKQIDPIEYNTRMDSLKYHTNLKEPGYLEEKEMIKVLEEGYSQNNPMEFFEFLQKLWKTLYINEFDVPKLHKSAIKDELEPEVIECPEILDELYNLQRIILFTNNLTKPYVIPISTYIDMILDSIRELYNNNTDLNLGQLSQSSDILLYILLTWIYSSMPGHCGLLFIIYFSMSKYIEISHEYTDEITEIFKEIHKTAQLTSDEVLKVLKEKFLNLIPENFQTSAFKHLETFELYRDCRLSKTIPAGLKLLIYSKLRIDLIPQACFDIFTDLMGYRYSYMPPPSFHKIAMYCEALRPLVVVYEENSPLEMIKTECEEMAIHLEVIQPMMKLISAHEKRESSEINCRLIMKPLMQKVEFKKWIVIENANTINSSEVESLLSAVVGAVSDPLCKVIFIIQGDINNCSHLFPIFDISYKMHFTKPETVKERITDWYCWHDKIFYLKYRQQMLEKYHYHLTSSPTVTTNLFSKKNMKGKGPLRKVTSALVFTNQIANILSFSKSDEPVEQNILYHLPYNISLFTSFMHLRSQYSSPQSLTYSNTMHIIKDLPTYLSRLDSSNRLIALSKFIEIFWPEELGEIFRMITSNTNSVNVMVNNKNLVYPLFAATKREGYEGLQTLIELMTSEDHLKVVGVNHSILRMRQAEKGKEMLKFIPEFLQMMKSMVLSISIKNNLDIPHVRVSVADRELRISEYQSLLPERFCMRIDAKVTRVSDYLKQELQQYEEFYNEVMKKLKIINKFIQYKTSMLSASANEIFQAILNNQVPQSWQKREPYCLRRFSAFNDWISAFGKLLVMSLGLDMRIYYSPLSFFFNLIRTSGTARMGLTAEFAEEGLKGLMIINGKITDGELQESLSFFELPALDIQIDNSRVIQDNYIKLLSESNEPFTSLTMFEDSQLSFRIPSKLTREYCKFKQIRVEIAELTP